MIEFLNDHPSLIYGIQLLVAQLLILLLLPKRRRWGLFYALELAVFLPIAYFFPDVVWLGTFYLPLFLLVPLIILGNYLILNVSFKEALFVAVCIGMMQHLAECMTMAIRYLFSSMTMDSVWWFVISYLCYAVVYTLFFFLFRLHKKDINMKSVKLICMIFAVYFIIYTLRNIAVTLSDTYQVNHFLRATINGYAAVCCFFCMIFMFTSNKADDLNTEKKAMEKLLEREQVHYGNLVAQQDIINRKCHDLKYEIAAMRKLPSEAQNEVLAGLEHEVMIYENFAKSGNAPLDYTLSEKNLYCVRHNIKFTYIVDGKLLSFMQATDIYALFGNAIDNAIECVTKYDDEEKRIVSINVTLVGTMIRLHFENYCEEEEEILNGSIRTTKKDKNYHGFGLKSIRFIAEKYGGIMNISRECNMFLLDILIPVPNGRDGD